MSELTENKRKISTRDLVTMAMFTAILCVSSYISIPLPLPGAPHITMLNFMIILVALLLPVGQSFLTIFVWMMLGVIGIPVFIAGGSGIGYLIAPYGFYTVAFLLVAVILPIIRGKSYNRIIYTIAAIVGVVVIDLIGMVWLKVSNGLTWGVAFSTGFAVFIPLDLVKAVVAAQIVPAFKRIIK